MQTRRKARRIPRGGIGSNQYGTIGVSVAHSRPQADRVQRFAAHAPAAQSTAARVLRPQLPYPGLHPDRIDPPDLVREGTAEGAVARLIWNDPVRFPDRTSALVHLFTPGAYQWDLNGARQPVEGDERVLDFEDGLLAPDPFAYYGVARAHVDAELADPDPLDPLDLDPDQANELAFVFAADQAEVAREHNARAIMVRHSLDLAVQHTAMLTPEQRDRIRLARTTANGQHSIPPVDARHDWAELAAEADLLFISVPD